MCCAVALGATVLLGSSVAAAQAPRQVTDRDMVWDTRVLSLESAYAALDAVPALRPYRARLIDRAGLHSVNPQVIALIVAEAAPGALDGKDTAAAEHYLDALVAAVAGMYDLGRSIARLERQDSATTAPDDAGMAAVAETFFVGEQRTRGFASRFAARFSALNHPVAAEPSQKSAPQTSLAAPADFLRLPWTLGQTGWSFNGVHTTTGGCGTAPCASPQSLIDFSLGWPVWGSDTSKARVLAAHDGTVTVFSSCNIRVTHSNGWATNYYHLDAPLVATGAVVYVGQPIAIYANNSAQALCQGGSSTGPHVHFSLLYNGAHTALDQSTLSGWTVNATLSSGDYDSLCTHMNLSRAGITACAYNGASPSAWAMHTLPSTMASNTRCALDVDGNGVVDAATDGVLLLRYLLGARGSALTSGALGAGATRNTAGAVESFLATRNYDLDVDGVTLGGGDGLMALRVLRGITGNAVGTGAIRGGGLLINGTQVAAYVAGCR
ncbi:MAG: M23 family metallopeptidase [Burkholderiales bacterium]|nr:M23 family metallopeptidase [Burkholderiales bacterium]